ncbi:MAG TPA: hypothetical protein VHK28_05060, partial [Candidatus Limnocylindria bacterium]|nr:hypothetical protein [Candidatus Limnocylindria bacterium]
PSASRPRAAGATMAGLASLLVALLPTAAAAAAVGIGVAIAAPGAFTSPDLETPILLRLASDVWPLLLVLAAAMVLSQALGAVAFRRATAHLPQPLAAAITGSVADLLRRPASRLGTAAAGMLVDGVLLILTWAVLRVLWAPIAADLGVGRLGGPDTLLLLLGFVAVWLVLLLAAGAWHVAMSAWWALELARDGSEARQVPHRIEDAGTTLDQPTP